MKFLKIALMTITLICLVSCGLHIGTPFEYADSVYPTLDTENSRWFYFSSASRPFGMVNLIPDTKINGDWSSGYRYNIDTIKGFSHIHCWQISGISVMPITISERDNDYYTNYYSMFHHDDEVVEVGYHKVELDRYSIDVELTSTSRVGFHRYHFPEGKEAAVVFSLEGILGPCKIKDARLDLIDNYTITGYMVDDSTARRPKEFKVFFIAKFDQKIIRIKESLNSKNKLVCFGDKLNEPLKMKVGVSYTSVKNAELNMTAELNHWDFDKVVKESKAEWNTLLGRIIIKGGSREERSRFYTDLWHGLQGRRIISDINGAYPDNTGEAFRVGQLPLDVNGKPKFNHYNSDSFWGAQWTLNTLWGLAYPDIYEEFVNSLLTYYMDGGLVPRGPSGGNYTYVMTGASTTPFIVSAIQKGIIKNDIAYIYEALKKNHMPGGMMGHAGYEHNSAKGGGIEYYINKGYVPYPLPVGEFGFHQEGAGQTLEYAYQDWTLAQLAKNLSLKNDYNYFIKRSENYKNLFDSVTGWIRPKNSAGEWLNPFDPYEYKSGFVEANSAQFTWFVPQNLIGLAELMGGEQKAIEKLNQQFIEAEKFGFTSGTSHAVETHPEYRRIPINYGNEPSIQTAFIFNDLGRPDLTQYWSRRIIKEAYSALSTARGYNGDEDQGLMGALAVLMKIGLFQMNGGTEVNPVYEIGSPIFDEVTINLHGGYFPGKKFVIRAENNSMQNVYVKAITLNGKNISDYKIRHHDIVNGGELILEMSKKINE